MTTPSTIQQLPSNIPCLKADGSNWAIFVLHFCKAMQVAWRWPYFEGTIPCPSPKNPAKVSDDERKAIDDWEFEDLAARYLLSQRLPDSIAIHLQSLTTAKARWDHLVFKFTAQSIYAQNDLEEAFFSMACAKGEDVRVFLTSLRYKCEELAAAGVRITQREYQRTILKSLPDDLAEFAAQLLSSAQHSGHTLDTDTLINSIIEESEHLKNRCTHSQQGQGEKKKKEGHTDEALTDMGSKGSHRRHCRGHCHSCGKPGHWACECCQPKKDDTAGASNTQKSGSTPPAEFENKPTGSANMVAEHSFEGDGFWTVVEEEVAPALTFGADPDPIVGDPDDICVGPQDLAWTFTWDGPDDWLCDEAAEIKEELDCAVVTPCEEDTIPLPQEVTGPSDGPPPELTRAPIDAEGPWELLPDGAPQCVTWLKSQVLAWALGGNKSLGEVHRYPLNLLDLYFKDPSEGEPNVATPKARRPAFDECARAHLGSWPGPGAAATELDVCITASVLLEGEQNNNLPSVGSEQYAAQSAPRIFLFPPSLDTCMRGIAPGECAAPVQRATSVQHAAPVQHANPHLEVLKPPDWNETPLEEPGGVLLGYIHTAEKVGAEATECTGVNTNEPEGASLDANAAPIPTKGIASIEPASRAVEATTARPEVLEPREKRAEWSELQLPLPP